MKDADFDIIVIGAGIAGSVAAFVAAQQGKSVLVVERGEYAGAKNMTGGRIYLHSLQEVFETYGEDVSALDEAPFERIITHERIALLDEASQVAFDVTTPALSTHKARSASVLRAPFDQWLAEKAEGAGAEFIYGIAVEALLKDESGAVYGIQAGEDQITASVVIVAEGVNSLLTERSLQAKRPLPHQMAVGIKQTFELPAQVIEDRFLLPAGEGAAMLFVGDCTHGRTGGGFLYTNKESISLGLVCSISSMQTAGTTVYQVFEDFKAHPAVAPILRQAEMVEHSGHMVSEGGYHMMPRHTFDGALVVGDAAMLCMNLGYQVRGMDFAAASGRFAAEAACEAIDRGLVTEQGLAGYGRRLEESFVIKDLKTFKDWPAVMDEWHEMFTDYPTMAREVFEAMFVVDGTPQEHLMRRVMPIVKKRGMFKLFKQMKGALKAL